MSLYFGKFELQQLIEDGWEYFFDMFNYFNVAPIVLNILICLSYGYCLDMFTPMVLYLLMSLSIFSIFINCFYWMRFFESTSRYVRMIFSSIAQIQDFLLVQLVFICAFGFAVYFLGQGVVYKNA